jgi:hypothetical protein
VIQTYAEQDIGDNRCPSYPDVGELYGISGTHPSSRTQVIDLKGRG